MARDPRIAERIHAVVRDRLGMLRPPQAWGKRAQRAAQACVAGGADRPRLDACLPGRPDPHALLRVNLSVIRSGDRAAALGTVAVQVGPTPPELVPQSHRHRGIIDRVGQVAQHTADLLIAFL